MPDQSTTKVTESPPQSGAPLVIVILLMFDSLHFVFARLLKPHLPGEVSAMYVLTVAALEVALFMALRRRIRFSVFRDNMPFFLSIGALVAASTAINYIAIKYIDPGTASMLSKTSTLFALGFSLVWLRERLAPVEVTGALIALAGVFVISFQPGDFLRLGSLMVVGSAFLYSLHTAVIKRHGGELDFGNFFLFRVASTSAFLILFVGARGTFVWPSAEAWPYLILAGTVDVVISRVLFYLALRRLQMSFHTIILTLSPVITILWSLLLFNERPTLQGFLGGAAVIAGVAIVTMHKANANRRPATVSAK